MELPSNLKNLYRHWSLHIAPEASSPTPERLFKDEKLYKEIVWFINERINIWKKKVSNESPPHTTDPVLSKYRFCNIFREFDRQTIEFHTLLNPLRNNFPLWLLNMFYCRLVAKPQTIKTVGLLSFDTEENKKFYERLIGSSRPRFGTPYVFPVSAILKSETPTRELFIARYLPKIMNSVAKKIFIWDKKSVYEGLQEIIPIFGYNLYFLWTEVLIDVAYQFPQHINLFDRFPVGPGSFPTLKKIDQDKDPSILVKDLSSLKLNSELTYDGKLLRLSAENWEGIGCEFRKYTNLRQGGGRKRLFVPNF